MQYHALTQTKENKKNYVKTRYLKKGGLFECKSVSK